MSARKRMKGLSAVLVVLLLSVTAASFVAAQESTPESIPEAAVTERPFLGVRLEDVDDTVVIQTVLADSAAAEAGLQEDDVITAVNGTSVTSASEVSDLIGELNPGDTVTIDYTRDGESASVDVVLGNMQDMMGGRGMRGAMIVYDEDAQVWQVQDLSEDSSLYEAGLRSGDTISAIDGEQYDQDGLQEYLAGLEEDTTVTLTIVRDGESLELTASLTDLGSFGGMGRMGDDPGMGQRPGDDGQRGQNPPDQGGAPNRGDAPGQGNPPEGNPPGGDMPSGRMV